MNCKDISESSLNAISKLHPQVIEKLLQAKQELTFSSQLCTELNPKLSGQNQVALIEIKGKDFIRKTKKAKKLTKNSHDIVVLDSKAQTKIIIENKVWYHFDGVKGKRGELNKNISSGIIEDIVKIQETMKSLSNEVQGFILIHVITPKNLTSIPDAYRKSHNSSLKREGNDFTRLRSKSIFAISQELLAAKNLRAEINHVASPSHNSEDFYVDILCAEVESM